jgi:hypothetical protein
MPSPTCWKSRRWYRDTTFCLLQERHTRPEMLCVQLANIGRKISPFPGADRPGENLLLHSQKHFFECQESDFSQQKNFFKRDNFLN